MHSFTDLSHALTIQESIGLTNKKMLSYYEYAQELFENKRYQDAADILLFLSTLNPYIYEIWQARGIAEYQLRNFKESLYAFQMAIALDRTRRDAYIGLIYTLLDQEEEEAAFEVLTLMQQLIPDVNVDELKTQLKEKKDGRQ